MITKHPFSVLVDKFITEFSVTSEKDAVNIRCSDGSEFTMHHVQTCCESVYVEDVCGDISDLFGVPILLAEEVSSRGGDEGGPGMMGDWEESYTYTWTFYKLSTIKGSVTIRWYGSSNGWYSESVDFVGVNHHKEF